MDWLAPVIERVYRDLVTRSPVCGPLRDSLFVMRGVHAKHIESMVACEDGFRGPGIRTYVGFSLIGTALAAAAIMNGGKLASDLWANSINGLTGYKLD